MVWTMGLSTMTLYYLYSCTVKKYLSGNCDVNVYSTNKIQFTSLKLPTKNKAAHTHTHTHATKHSNEHQVKQTRTTTQTIAANHKTYYITNSNSIDIPVSLMLMVFCDTHHDIDWLVDGWIDWLMDGLNWLNERLSSGIEVESQL